MSIEELLDAAKYSGDQINNYKNGTCYCSSGLKPSLYLYEIKNSIGFAVLLYCDTCVKYTKYPDRLRKLDLKECFTLMVFNDNRTN